MNNPVFSVIIPTFNAVGTIENALNSIFSQKLKNFEILVLDANSQDDTIARIKPYAEKDDRIKYISENDNGIYDAMNKGVRLAKGEWMFFMGCDDSLYSDDVFSHVEAFARSNKNAHLIYGNVCLNKPIGVKNKSLVYDGEFDADKLLKKNICHQSAFYKKPLFDRFGLFRTQYKIFADYDFNLRCFNKVSPQYIDKIIANFNVDGQSNTQQALDTLFEEEFLENMALHYSYNHKSRFFNGRKKELFGLLMKKMFSLNAKHTVRIAKILAYQWLKGRRPNTTNIPTHQIT